ncbi:MAG: pantetheine-phosphate adenylyltransferase [Candidatus Tritonobacter lacicola]|nr:pantetheine-phosphate adenylyltransferase [Candidatus Tritonobacter lacicola]
MTRKAIYAGSFDPVTYGHLDVISRALRFFDELTVAVAASQDKNPLFSLPERVDMLSRVTGGMEGVCVEGFEGLLTGFAAKREVKLIIRGLRALTDFEYEFQMALTNRKLDDSVETVFMMPSEAFSYVSSSMIKEIVKLGGSVRAFVPLEIEEELKRKLRK